MSTTTSKDGTSISFDRTGEGPAVILVDGATAFRAINPMSGELSALLSPQYTVISYDRRGRGESGDTQPYAVQREIEDLEALINEVGGSASLFGISSGAVLALEAAASGLPVTKLALYEPPFVVDDGRPPLPDDYVAQLDAAVADGRRGDAVELFMTKAAGLPAEYLGGMREAPFWPVMEGIAHTIAYDGAIMGDTMSGDPAPLKKWASVAVPTLVADGGASEAYMHNAADALAAVLPNAQRVTLDGQTHQVAPDAVAPALRDFLAR